MEDLMLPLKASVNPESSSTAIPKSVSAIGEVLAQLDPTTKAELLLQIHRTTMPELQSLVDSLPEHDASTSLAVRSLADFTHQRSTRAQSGIINQRT